MVRTLILVFKSTIILLVLLLAVAGFEILRDVFSEEAQRFFICVLALNFIAD